MDIITINDQKTFAIELANAIASFDINKVDNLLKDDGEYTIQDEKDEIVINDKSNFITWLINALMNSICKRRSI